MWPAGFRLRKIYVDFLRGRFFIMKTLHLGSALSLGVFRLSRVGFGDELAYLSVHADHFEKRDFKHRGGA